MRRIFSVLTILAAFALSACQPLPPTVFISPTSTLEAFTSPLKTPAPDGLATSVAGNTSAPPVVSPDRSFVTGVLQYNSLSPVSVNDAILYLGSIHLDASGTPLLAGLDKQTAPRTTTDRSGKFVFADVPPGTYVLVLDRINETFLLNDPISGKDLLIKAQAGQVVDLGHLVYASLPGVGAAP